MGNPFVHLDLATTDLAAAKQFYSEVFDWKFEEMPQMGYIGINVGEGVGGGMGTVSPDQPPSWTAYVDVADVRETMARAEAAGARVLVGYMPVGDMGWLGVFMDPQGATIGVWQTARPPAPAGKQTAAPAAAKRKAAPPAAKRKAAPPAAKAKAKAKPKAKAKAKAKPPARKAGKRR